MKTIQPQDQSSQTTAVISVVLSFLGLVCALIAVSCFFWLESEKRDFQVDDANSQVITNGLLWMLQMAVSIVGKMVGGSVAVIGGILGVVSTAQRPNRTATIAILLSLIAIIALCSIQVLG